MTSALRRHPVGFAGRWIGEGLAGAVLLLLAAPVCAIAAPPARLEAGAGRADVAIPATALPLDGFGSVHDPLQARVLLLDDGARRLALAVIDQTSISADSVAAMQQLVAQAAGVRPSDALIIASHTFSAPHFFAGSHLPPGLVVTADDARRGALYQRALADAVTRAATIAARHMQPARMGFAGGTSDVNVNRNVAMADGWWLGADDAGASDKTVSIVRFDGLDRRPIAILLNYAVQSAVMNQSKGADGTKRVTADLGGAAVRRVELDYGDPAVALFLTGTAGDQTPRYAAQRNLYDKDGHFRTVDIGDEGFPLVDLQGEHLGVNAVRTAGMIVREADRPALRLVSGSVSLDAQERPKSLQQIHPTRSYAFSVVGKVDAPYWLLRIGEVALVGVQAELSAETGAAIRRQSPFAHTLVVTMVNGAAKYMPPADDYRKITYEAMNSPFGAGSAELFSAKIVAALKTMHDEDAAR